MPRRLDPTRAVAYVRTSTGHQALSPEAQRSECRAFAERHGLEVVSVHAEVASGGAPLAKRPGLADALMAMHERRAGVLLVARRDRLGRDVALVAAIEGDLARRGGRVLAAEGAPNDATPEAKLMRQLLDAFSEYERTLIAARTRAALRAKRRRGEPTGGTARYGESIGDGGVLERDPAEALALDRIRELHSTGLGCRRIAAHLDAEGHPCRGRAWRPGTVAKIVRRLHAGR